MAPLRARAGKPTTYASTTTQPPDGAAAALWHTSCNVQERSTNPPKGGNTMAKKVVAKAVKKATKKAAKPAAKKTK